MARKRISVSTYYDQEALDELEALAARTRVPKAEYFREGLDLALELYSEHPQGAVARSERAASALRRIYGVPEAGEGAKALERTTAHLRKRTMELREAEEKIQRLRKCIAALAEEAGVIQ